MAYIGITASDKGLAVEPGGDLDALLARRLREIGPRAPVVILIHGYKFGPGSSAQPGADPHRSIYAFGPGLRSWKTPSWPEGLGFDPASPETGLCIGFAWPAAEAHLPSLLATGRNGFARVYDRAAEYGRRLAELIARIHAAAPGRAVDLLAHSLGARVALCALPHLATAPERIVLLGAAEFDTRAAEALAGLRAGREPQVYNVTARANDFYDLLLETFAPRRSRRDRAVGMGLREPLPCWLDLQLDRRDVTEWINAQGVALRPMTARKCHWSFYTHEGVFAVYQAILRRKPGWDLASLRASGRFAAQEPRWSRLAPAPRLPGLRSESALEGFESA